MAIAEAYFVNGLTVSTIELSIVNGNSTLANNTTAGVYQLFAFIEGVSNPTDIFRFRVMEKVLSGSTKRVAFEVLYFGHHDSGSAMTHMHIITPPLILMNGWDMTVIRVAGADKSIEASIRKVS